jgi:hypothetical protein
VSFEQFQDLYFQLLTRAGIPESRARSLAAVTISAIEGGIILARAQKSNAPLDRVLDELQRLFTDALGEAIPSKQEAA